MSTITKLVAVRKPVADKAFERWLGELGWIAAWRGLDVEARLFWALSFLSHPEVPAPVKVCIGRRAAKLGELRIA